MDPTLPAGPSAPAAMDPPWLLFGHGPYSETVLATWLGNANGPGAPPRSPQEWRARLRKVRTLSPDGVKRVVAAGRDQDRRWSEQWQREQHQQQKPDKSSRSPTRTSRASVADGEYDREVDERKLQRLTVDERLTQLQTSLNDALAKQIQQGEYVERDADAGFSRASTVTVRKAPPPYD